MIYLVTKNSGKLLAARSVFERHNIAIEPVNRGYPEIQANNSLEIARFTALQAAHELGAPAIREDHSLFINALGIPGPYTNYFEQKVPAQILLKILSNFSDRSGYFEVATVYAEPSEAIREYTFQVPIVFAIEERGNLQGGWNRIIMLAGETRTLAEYKEQERVHIWDKNYLAIAEYLSKHKDE